jgi:hypothetical protein
LRGTNACRALARLMPGFFFADQNRVRHLQQHMLLSKQSHHLKSCCDFNNSRAMPKPCWARPSAQIGHVDRRTSRTSQGDPGNC